MEEQEVYTTDKIAKIYSGCLKVVNQINSLSAISSLTDMQKDKLERLVGHLECIKGVTKSLDYTTTIWTTEDFTAIDAAITLGKTKY
tara:strand:- start:363 stop:623 length:261 start_codon:yes stop_codon:yes gene_type:complete